MAFAPIFQRPFSATFDRRAAMAAAVSWWLSGGVAAANAIAVYQPKGAASLAASYDNIAAPGNGLPDGTYDAAPGVAPTWASATGWTFDGATQYLATGAMVNTGYSAIVRFSGWTSTVTDAYLFGSFNLATVTLFAISPKASDAPLPDKATYWNGRNPLGRRVTLPTPTSGVLAFAGTECYRNGASDGALINAYAPTGGVYIGALNKDGTASNYGNGNIQAIAIYNTALSAAQVLAISTAMAAL